MHTKELREIYLDLRSVAQAHSFKGLDEQLNYIQKASLYIEKSLIGASHQWEFFSIMHDIRSAAIVDYFTLRHKGLGRAANEARYDVKFITVYQSQITNPVAKEDIDRALSVIAEIRTIYDELTTAIAPVARGGKPNQTL